MKRRGSWQINFIVGALTGMGSIFLVNQWMTMKHSCFCRTKCPVIFCVRMSWNSGSCHALWIMFYQFM